MVNRVLKSRTNIENINSFITFQKFKNTNGKMHTNRCQLCFCNEAKKDKWERPSLLEDELRNKTYIFARIFSFRQRHHKVSEVIECVRNMRDMKAIGKNLVRSSQGHEGMSDIRSKGARGIIGIVGHAEHQEHQGHQGHQGHQKHQAHQGHRGHQGHEGHKGHRKHQ